MNENTTETTVSEPTKARFSDRFKRNTTEKPVKNLRQKAKDAAALVGVVTVAGVVAAVVSKKTSKDAVEGELTNESTED